MKNEQKLSSIAQTIELLLTSSARRLHRRQFSANAERKNRNNDKNVKFSLSLLSLRLFILISVFLLLFLGFFHLYCQNFLYFFCFRRINKSLEKKMYKQGYVHSCLTIFSPAQMTVVKREKKGKRDILVVSSSSERKRR